MQNAVLRSVPAVVNTRAPKLCANWIAIVPIPLLPPCTSNVSPGCRPPMSKTIDQTVQVTSGSAAASTSDTPLGTGISCPTGTVTSSAYAPPAMSAQTGSPTGQPATPSPSATIVPEHSMPG